MPNPLEASETPHPPSEAPTHPLQHGHRSEPFQVTNLSLLTAVETAIAPEGSATEGSL
jgi:hypothetical protein